MMLRQNKGATHFHAKVQDRASIAGNWSTLHNFSTKQITRKGIMPKIRLTRTNSHLQHNTECI